MLSNLSFEVQANIARKLTARSTALVQRTRRVTAQRTRRVRVSPACVLQQTLSGAHAHNPFRSKGVRTNGLPAFLTGTGSPGTGGGAAARAKLSRSPQLVVLRTAGVSVKQKRESHPAAHPADQLSWFQTPLCCGGKDRVVISFAYEIIYTIAAHSN